MTVHLDAKSAGKALTHPESPVLVILLGASNLSRACFALSRHLKVSLRPHPVEVLIASGPGRGYCAPGGLLTITYPPIDSSEIFEVARRKSESGCRVIALVTDIGNDIMYDVPAEKLIETIEGIFTKLQSMNADVFYTTLPTAFENNIHPFWFYVLRTLLLPFSRVSYDQAAEGIIVVNQYLREYNSGHCHLIPDMDRYFGYDEIHYSWLGAHHAWSYVAQVMLDTLGVKSGRKIPLSGMLRSYGREFRQVILGDMMGFVMKTPEHY